MNGMIFAAGLGSRLAPYTDHHPKALVKVGGRPLLDYAVAHLIHEGVNHIVINVHHFADQIEHYVEHRRSHWKADVVLSSEREQLLETGGGLANALPLFPDDGPIVVCNADVLSNTPLQRMIRLHKERGHDATLMVSHRHSTRRLLFDADGLLVGWRNTESGEERMVRDVVAGSALSFNAFHIVEQRLVRALLPVRPMSIVSGYLDCADRFKIGHVEMSNSFYWFDVGTVGKLAMAEEFLYG